MKNVSTTYIHCAYLDNLFGNRTVKAWKRFLEGILNNGCLKKCHHWHCMTLYILCNYHAKCRFSGFYAVLHMSYFVYLFIHLIFSSTIVEQQNKKIQIRTKFTIQKVTEFTQFQYTMTKKKGIENRKIAGPIECAER